MLNTDPPRALQRKRPPHGEAIEINIGGFSEKWNGLLTLYFNQSVGRIRLYWFLAALIRHQSVRTANAMAFDFFLAFVPMLGLGGWAASLLVFSSSSPASSIAVLNEFTPEQLHGFIGEQFQAFSAAHLAPLAALAGLWLVSSAYNTMMGVFEESFDCQPRSWLSKRAISMIFATFSMLILSLGGGLGVISSLNWYQSLSEILDSTLGALLLRGALLMVTFSIAAAFLALLYRYSISRPGRSRKVWPGAFIATLLGISASIALGYYATNIARYALFYGGLAAIVVLLLWLWLWSSAILLGAEINIALEDVRHTQGALRGHHLATRGASSPPTQTPIEEGNLESD